MQRRKASAGSNGNPLYTFPCPLSNYISTRVPVISMRKCFSVFARDHSLGDWKWVMAMEEKQDTKTQGRWNRSLTREQGAFPSHQGLTLGFANVGQSPILSPLKLLISLQPAYQQQKEHRRDRVSKKDGHTQCHCAGGNAFLPSSPIRVLNWFPTVEDGTQAKQACCGAETSVHQWYTWPRSGNPKNQTHCPKPHSTLIPDPGLTTQSPNCQTTFPLRLLH